MHSIGKRNGETTASARLAFKVPVAEWSNAGRDGAITDASENLSNGRARGITNAIMQTGMAAGEKNKQAGATERRGREHEFEPTRLARSAMELARAQRLTDEA